jgi:hypothetical protein
MHNGNNQIKRLGFNRIQNVLPENYAAERKENLKKIRRKQTERTDKRT